MHVQNIVSETVSDALCATSAGIQICLQKIQILQVAISLELVGRFQYNFNTKKVY